MITLGAVVIVLLMLATGWVLLRRLVRLLLPPAQLPTDTELLMTGFLPALALVGTIATYLAFTHLFRAWIASALAVGILLSLRTDTLALARALRQLGPAIWRPARQGNLFPLLAAVLGVVFLVTALLLAQIPAENVDIWVFHLPLAQGFIANQGFMPHLIASPFYSSQPLLFELLFAVAMFAENHYVAADTVNIAIFFALLALVACFPKRARGFQVILILAVLCWIENFVLDAAQPMIDLPRACFSVGAFLFAYRYAVDFRRLDLILSALLAGTAVAGKYTELTTPALIGVALLPLIIRHKTWRDLIPAAIAFVVVAAPWYVKNWVLTGNPIYPFLFGHPGLSDQWLVDYMRDIGRPFDPADRVFSTNLLTLRGWHDFAHVFVRDFATLLPAVVIAFLGMALPQPRRWMLPLWSAVLFVIWYAVMFNGTRWATTAVLLVTVAFLMTLFWIVDRAVLVWNPARAGAMVEGVLAGAHGVLAGAARQLKTRPNLWPALISGGLALVIGLGLVRMAQHHGNFLLPRWMDRELARALVKPSRMERRLEETRPGYVMYRFIGEHNYSYVLQPFDNGGAYYASAYNGGKHNDWVLPYNVLPPKVEDTEAFVRNNGIRFFIEPEEDNSIDVERRGDAFFSLAHAVIARIKPHAHKIFTDNHGWALYAIDRFWP